MKVGIVYGIIEVFILANLDHIEAKRLERDFLTTENVGSKTIVSRTEFFNRSSFSLWLANGLLRMKPERLDLK